MGPAARFLGVLLLVVAGQTHAQDVAAVASPSPEMRCLKMPAGLPPYPAGAAQAKHGGIIRVRLTFTRSDLPPQSEVFFTTVDQPFRELVLDRVAHYRVPCLADGTTMVATQEFDFRFDDGRAVYWSEAREERPARRYVECLTGAERPLSYGMVPRWGRAEQGTVLLRLTFKEATVAPEVEVVFGSDSSRLWRLAAEYASNYRLPCLPPSDGPLTVLQGFHFSVEGENRKVLKDSSLTDLLAAAEGIEQARVRFDTTTMGCPFDLQFRLRQPVLPNEVGQVGAFDANRREFVEWIRTLRLKIPKSVYPQVFDDTMKVSVPCVVLNLN